MAVGRHHQLNAVGMPFRESDMSEGIFVDPSATEADVIRVVGACYQRFGEAMEAPDIFANDIEGEFSECISCEKSSSSSSSSSVTMSSSSSSSSSSDSAAPCECPEGLASAYHVEFDLYQWDCPEGPEGPHVDIFGGHVSIDLIQYDECFYYNDERAAVLGLACRDGVGYWYYNEIGFSEFTGNHRYTGADPTGSWPDVPFGACGFYFVKNMFVF